MDGEKRSEEFVLFCNFFSLYFILAKEEWNGKGEWNYEGLVLAGAIGGVRWGGAGMYVMR